MNANTTQADPASTMPRPLPLTSERLRVLQRRSDRAGSLRLAAHLAAGAVAASLYALSLGWPGHSSVGGVALSLALCTAFGFTLVTMFAAMHESVHRTAFETRWLNDLTGWFAGVLSFYNSTFYRHYHGWHHRFTQIRGRDPELDDPRPVGLASYLVEMSGYYWWIGKLRTHGRIALGRVGDYPFLSDTTRPVVVRSVRLQLLVYAVAIAASLAAGQPWFLTFWLVPVALGQPLLRFILLAEHTGCSENDDPLANTRTTHTLAPVRFLMWEMPYHAEHHRYPALPFFSLGRAHEVLGPELEHVARRGYFAVHVEFLRSLARARRASQNPAGEQPVGQRRA